MILSLRNHCYVFYFVIVVATYPPVYLGFSELCFLEIILRFLNISHRKNCISFGEVMEVILVFLDKYWKGDLKATFVDPPRKLPN